MQVLKGKSQVKNQSFILSVVALLLCLMGCKENKSASVAPGAQIDPCPVPAAAAVTVAINEVMLENVSTLPDGNGQYYPWIEFYNFGPDPVDLANAYFSDSTAEDQRWQFPCGLAGTVIEPGDFLVLFFGGDGNPDDLHIDFMPEETGDQIYVLNQSSDFFDFNSDLIGEDESIGRFQDGGEMIDKLSTPTPGSANAAPDGVFTFVRGDLDLDLDVDFEDYNLMIDHFGGSPVVTNCPDRLDINDDGIVSTPDFLLLGQLMTDPSVGIPEPYPAPGIDPTPDSMECEGP